MQTTLNQLEQVEQLLTRGWTQGGFARNSQDKIIPPSDVTAVCWCLMGSILRVLGENPADEPTDRQVVLYESFKEPLREFEYPETDEDVGLGLVKFNDAANRTQQEVLNVVHSAIEIERKNP